MINVSLHNTVDVSSVRVCSNTGEKTSSGWVTIHFNNHKWGWDDPDNDPPVSNEVCIFFKDLEHGYASLMQELMAGMAEHRREVKPERCAETYHNSES